MFYRGTCTISEYNASNTYAFLVQLDGRGFRLVSGMVAELSTVTSRNACTSVASASTVNPIVTNTYSAVVV
jgi:hypothetical protein